MTTDSTLDLQALYGYLLDNSLREEPLLNELRRVTAEDSLARLQIAPEQGQFMALIAQLIQARRILEIGTFTGYSSLCFARALPEDGYLLCCDIDQHWTDIAQDYWHRAGLSHKIELRLAPAAQTLQTLIDTPTTAPFDLAFIDADKEGYDTYYEQCLRLIRPNGLIIFDNTLWYGQVADPDINDADTLAIRALNQKLHQDSRVDISLIPMADGITLARKR